jgi:hypothetical protein
MDLRTFLLLLAAALGPVRGVTGQSNRTLAETARWLETDGTDMATSSSDTTLTNVRMVSLTAKASLALDACRLTITVTDNSGVSGSRTTMQVPLKEVDPGGVRVVARAEGYHDFIYIPGKYFVTIPARAPDTYPFLTTTRQGELRSYLATIPAKDAEAGSMLLAAVLRAVELCGAQAPPR